METIWDETLLQDVLESRLTKKGFISVGENDPLVDCLDMMLKHKISAVPVMKNGEDSDGQVIHCIGIVDVYDVLKFLVKELEVIEGWTGWAPVKFRELMQGVKVKDIMDLAHGDPLVVGNAKSSLKSVVRFFSSGLSHRCVVHLKGNDFAVLSQVDVMHFLAKKNHRRRWRH